MPAADAPRPATGRASRPHGRRIEVWLTADEKQALTDRAAQAGLSLSAYMRAAGLNHPIRAVADTQAVADLVKVSADLGRLGGLLKLWLAERRGEGAPPVSVDRVLGETRNLQQRMRELASQVRRR